MWDISQFLEACAIITIYRKQTGAKSVVCTFFGHRDCFDLDEAVLWSAIENLINQGVDAFYVGNQGE